MAGKGRKTWTVFGVALACAGATGCGSSQAYPFDRQTVWRATVGEAVALWPERIDDKDFTIRSTLRGLSGEETRYDIKVDTDYNPFARRPSTRVFVSAEQTQPKRGRVRNLEKEFLARLGQKLQEYAAGGGG